MIINRDIVFERIQFTTGGNETIMMIRMAGTAPLDALRSAVGIEDLCFAERFVLWTIRVWVKATPTSTSATLDNRAAITPPALLVNAYRQIGASHAIEAIKEAMGIIRIYGTRALAAQYPCANTLTDDETRILQVLACCQNGIVPATRPVLTSMLPHTTALTALESLNDWAEILAAAGMSLPVRDWDLPELRGPATLHSNQSETRLLN